MRGPEWGREMQNDHRWDCDRSTPGEAERVDASTARHEGRRRVLGTIAGHECVVSVMGDTVYDRDGHGTWYLCGYVSDADALSRWRGWLRSQGVSA